MRVFKVTRQHTHTLHAGLGWRWAQPGVHRGVFALSFVVLHLVAVCSGPCPSRQHTLCCTNATSILTQNTFMSAGCAPAQMPSLCQVLIGCTLCPCASDLIIEFEPSCSPCRHSGSGSADGRAQGRIGAQVLPCRPARVRASFRHVEVRVLG